MSEKINKPVCVIVGVGPGNGGSFARRFALEGYQVALLSRRTDFTMELAKEIDDARAYSCDVTDPVLIESTFASICTEMGEIDILIFNPGAGIWKTVEESTPEEFEQSWRVNAMGGFLVSKQVIPFMKLNNRGNIIFIGATASRRGGTKTAAFAPAKAAQRSLAESMARHLGPSGVHVAHIIVDGVVDTPATREMMQNKPNNYFIQPDDIAEVLIHLTQQKPSAWSFEIEVRPFGEVW
jgi:NAD(P)-dependent dehydrogenase (short-subunit alcohol dehydrogenase family)